MQHDLVSYTQILRCHLTRSHNSLPNLSTSSIEVFLYTLFCLLLHNTSSWYIIKLTNNRQSMMQWKWFSLYRDNIYTDVFGANLYDRYLSRRNVQESKRIVNLERSIEELLVSDTSDWDHSAESCLSILVQVSFLS